MLAYIIRLVGTKNTRYSVTVEELLEGKELEHPPYSVTFKKAPKSKKKEPTTGSLL